MNKGSKKHKLLNKSDDFHIFYDETCFDSEDGIKFLSKFFLFILFKFKKKENYVTSQTTVIDNSKFSKAQMNLSN